MRTISRPTAATVALVVLAGLVATTAAAATLTFRELKSVSARTTIDAKAFGELTVLCEREFSLLSQTVTAGRPQSMILRGEQPLLADGSAPIIDGIYGEPAGVKVSVYNGFDAAQTLDVQVLCGKFDPAVQGHMAAATVNVVAKQRKSAVAKCAQNYFALGGGFFAPAVANLFAHPEWQLGPSLASRSNGVQPEPPDAWAGEAANPGTTDQPYTVYAYCRGVPAASLEASVGSLELAPGEQRFVGLNPSTTAFVLGGGMNGGDEAIQISDAIWRPSDDPAQPAGFNFAFPIAEKPWILSVVHAGGIYGAFTRDLRQGTVRKAAAPVKVAVIVAPGTATAPPARIVTAVEYYNSVRDHYFITSIPQEISDLDLGVHPGWQRTNQTFNVYAAGSGGPLGRLPFCRYYGRPEAGLDSHFYTGSALECLDVLAKFAGAWQLESGEVFQAQLPNIVTGACPAGTVPVLRTWNQRADSNHRYTTSLALRNQMLAQGHIAEGYGPDGVAFCAPA